MQPQNQHDFTTGAAVHRNQAVTTLSEDQLRRFAPSIFATEPYEGMSDRYGFIPTIDVVRALADVGLLPVKASENYVRNPDKAGYAKHTLRFRNVTDAGKKFYVGDSVFEVALTNSHDGSSAYVLEPALFKFACSNGLLIATGGGAFQAVSIRHSRRVAEEAIDASYQIVEELPALGNLLDRFRKTRLTTGQQLAFATAATELRWPAKDEESVRTNPPIRVDQLLTPKRSVDAEPTLWNTLNVVQEHLIKGGDSGRTATGRRHTTRKVKSISEDQRINRALWVLATELEKRVAA